MKNHTMFGSSTHWKEWALENNLHYVQLLYRDDRFMPDQSAQELFLEITKWCEENCTNEYYGHGMYDYAFKSSNDALIFKTVWG